MRGLAAILEQSEAWLALGSVPELPKKVALLRDARADGAVNFVAGLARMDGASPAFPRKEDGFDERHRVDLHLIIQGAHFVCHVTSCERTGATWTGNVPIESVHEGVTILAVCHVTGLSYRIFRLRAEDFEGKKARAGAYEFTIPGDGGQYREIETFGEMI